MEHGDEPVDMVHEDSEMDEDKPACSHCGSLFTSHATLARHENTCPQRPIPTSDVFGPLDDHDDDEENEDVWVDLIRHCNEHKQLKEKFEERKQEYIEDGESEKKAHLLTKKDIKPLMKLCMKQYTKNALTFVLNLKNSRFFEDILEDLVYFKKEKGFNWKKAIPAALDRNLDVFDEVLKDEDIGKQVRGKGERKKTDDYEESEDSIEMEEDESDEEAEKQIFP